MIISSPLLIYNFYKSAIINPGEYWIDLDSDARANITKIIFTDNSNINKQYRINISSDQIPVYAQVIDRILTIDTSSIRKLYFNYDSSYFLFGFDNVNEIIFNDKVDFSLIRNIAGFFAGNQASLSINKKLPISNCTDLSELFFGCDLTNRSIDDFIFGTARVIRADRMFAQYEGNLSATNIYLDLTSLESAESMFYGITTGIPASLFPLKGEYAIGSSSLNLTEAFASCSNYLPEEIEIDFNENCNLNLTKCFNGTDLKSLSLFGCNGTDKGKNIYTDHFTDMLGDEDSSSSIETLCIPYLQINNSTDELGNIPNLNDIYVSISFSGKYDDSQTYIKNGCWNNFGENTSSNITGESLAVWFDDWNPYNTNTSIFESNNTHLNREWIIQNNEIVYIKGSLNNSKDPSESETVIIG